MMFFKIHNSNKVDNLKSFKGILNQLDTIETSIDNLKSAYYNGFSRDVDVAYSQSLLVRENINKVKQNIQNCERAFSEIQFNLNKKDDKTARTISDIQIRIKHANFQLEVEERLFAKREVPILNDKIKTDALKKDFAAAHAQEAAWTDKNKNDDGKNDK